MFLTVYLLEFCGNKVHTYSYVSITEDIDPFYAVRYVLK